MSDCILCQIQKGEAKAFKVYDDEDLVAVMHPFPANNGHIIIFAKDHKMSIAEVEDTHLSKMFSLAQKFSAAVFDAYGAKGTNVLVQSDGCNHLSVHVIPRSDGDGISFDWQPKQADEGQLTQIEQKLKEAAKDIKPPEAQSEVIKGDDNYMIRNLKRTP